MEQKSKRLYPYNMGNLLKKNFTILYNYYLNDLNNTLRKTERVINLN